MSDDNGLYTRQVAYKILVEVLGKKAPLDQTLARHKDFNILEGRERNLARMIVATVLRRKGQMDTLIEKAQDKKQELRPSTIYYLLYVGIAQLLFMDVPDHAAVDVTVRLTEAEKMERQKGLINALLRRIGREGKGWLANMDEAQTNIPQWLLEQWVKDYGLTDAAKIAQASLTEAKTDITLKDHKEHWVETLDSTMLPTGSLRRHGGGSVIDLEGFNDGAWWVQDASAAIPARLFGDIKDKTVIDLCAAPGGKTSQLAAQGAQVIALTGTLRRHPDVMHLKSGHDVSRLGDLQTRLLDNTAKMIKPDGMIIYCTCSLQKSEGEGQVGQFLTNNEGFVRKPITADEVGGLSELITKEGDVRILPYHLADLGDLGGMDGFYVARLVKV